MKKHQSRLKKIVKRIRVMNGDVKNTIDYFTTEGLLISLEKLGWKLDKKKGYILDRNSNPIKCDCCKKHLTDKELSAFSSGSVESLCSDIRCHVVNAYRRDKK